MTDLLKKWECVLSDSPGHTSVLLHDVDINYRMFGESRSRRRLLDYWSKELFNIPLVPGPPQLCQLRSLMVRSGYVLIIEG